MMSSGQIQVKQADQVVHNFDNRDFAFFVFERT